MSTTQCSLELGNERYIQACTLDNGERRVDIREWKSSENRQFPTINISLYKNTCNFLVRYFTSINSRSYIL